MAYFMKHPRNRPRQLVLPFLKKTPATKWFDVFHHKLTEAAGFGHVSAPHPDNDSIIVDVTSSEAREQLLQALSENGDIPSDVHVEVTVVGDPRND